MQRGLKGVELVISDAHEGIKAAVARVLATTWLRCRVHFMRNALAHARKSGRRLVSAFVATAFAQEDAQAAKQQWRRVADQLRPSVPKLAMLMDAAEADVLAYLDFPTWRRPKLHSTNPVEWLNREVKRRTDVVGIFPNEAAITRLVGAVLLEQRDEWAVQHRRYMTLENAMQLGDHPFVSPRLTAPAHAGGPNLRALALHLRFSQNIGFDRLRGVYHDVFGVRISAGALVKMTRAGAAPFAAQAGPARRAAARSPVLASDETGLRVAGRNFWRLGCCTTATARCSGRPQPRQAGPGGPARRAPPRLLDIPTAMAGRRASRPAATLLPRASDPRRVNDAVDAGDAGFAPGFLGLLRRACRLGAIRDRLSDRQLAAYHRKFVRKLMRACSAGNSSSHSGSSCSSASRASSSVMSSCSARAARHVPTMISGCRKMPRSWSMTAASISAAGTRPTGQASGPRFSTSWLT